MWSYTRMALWSSPIFWAIILSCSNLEGIEEACIFHSAGSECHRELLDTEDRVHHPLQILCLRHGVSGEAHEVILSVERTAGVGV